MPFINVKTNAAVSKEQCDKIKSALGQAITALPGKSENWLMVGIEPEQILYFQGSDAPAAMVQVQTYGTNAQGSNDLTAKICKILNAELNLPQNRVYVSYFGTQNWGWNGNNF
jgi:phenylpyruvate tautomerase PptA (4-oxalocrotonate tautomerase family)